MKKKTVKQTKGSTRNTQRKGKRSSATAKRRNTQTKRKVTKKRRGTQQKQGAKMLQEIMLEILVQKRAHRKDDFIQKVIALIPDAKERKVDPRYLIARKIRSMHEDGLISVYETNFSSFISITQEGRQRLFQRKLLSKETLIPQQWDGFWRIVIVNVPREEKEKQDAIRYILKKSNFVQLKPSIWISPLPLEPLINEIKKNLSLENEILILTARHFDPFTSETLEANFLAGVDGEQDFAL